MDGNGWYLRELSSGQDSLLNSLFQLWMLGALDNLGAGFSDSLGQRYVPRPENVSASLRTSRSWETRWRNSHWHRAQQQTLASQRIDPINACKYSTRIAVWNHNGHGDSASLRTHHCQKCSLLVKRLAVARRPDAWALHSTIIPSTISIHVIQWFRFLCQKRNILKLTYAFWIDLSALVASLFPWIISSFRPRLWALCPCSRCHRSFSDQRRAPTGQRDSFFWPGGVKKT